MDELPCLFLSQEFRSALLRLPPQIFNNDPATIAAAPTPGPSLPPDGARNTTHWLMPDLFAPTLDRYDVRMTDNAVAVLTAFLTGLSMLLLTDLFFRVVVRAGEGHDASKRQRYGLLSAVTNPIGWLGDLASNKFAASRAADCTEQSEADFEVAKVPNRLSAQSRVATAGLGILLIALDLTLLYLLCTHERNVPVNTASLPAFEFRDPGSAALLVQEKPLCDSMPVTRRDGFRSMATAYTCAFSMFRDFDVLNRSDVAFVGASWGFKRVVFDVLTQGLANTYLQEVFIGLDNGTQYTTEPVVRAADVARVLPAVLARRNLRVLREIEIPRPPNGTASFMQWSALYMVDMRGVRAPASFSDALNAGLNLSGVALSGGVPRASVEANLYLASVARSALALSGRSTAFHRDPDNGPFLHWPGAVLVRAVGPRLGVRDSGVVCAGMLVVWLWVAFVLRWGSGLDKQVSAEERRYGCGDGDDVVSPSSSVGSVEDGLEKGIVGPVLPP